MTKPGYLYVLVHPSDPELFKVGVTILDPADRLAQHNTQHDKYAGRVVRETGQCWEIKTYVEVPDPYWAERAFWGATPLADIPGLGGVEVQRMKWEWVECGLRAARGAGVRPPPVAKPKRDRAWMVELLQDTGIEMVGRYRGLVTRVEFRCRHGHVFEDSPGVMAWRKSCAQCQGSSRNRGEE